MFEIFNNKMFGGNAPQYPHFSIIFKTSQIGNSRPGVIYHTESHHVYEFTLCCASDYLPFPGAACSTSNTFKGILTYLSRTHCQFIHLQIHEAVTARTVWLLKMTHAWTTQLIFPITVTSILIRYNSIQYSKDQRWPGHHEEGVISCYRKFLLL